MDRQGTSHAERVEMVERHLAGEALGKIAKDMGLSYYTVRKWWRVYQREGWQGLVSKAAGPSRVGLLGRFSPKVKYVALRLKKEHPGWGPDVLLLKLSQRISLKEERLPKRSTLAKYLAQFGRRLGKSRRLSTRRPEEKRAKAQQAHECWQADFKGEEVVGGCKVVVMPLMICDEASGAPLEGLMHEVQVKGRRTGLNTRSVQNDLRQAFENWGMPDAIRTDRDPLFVGSTRLQWPGTLQLWLVGLGIQPIINRAYKPTDNAIVERNNRTWEEHVLQGQSYQDVHQVQHQTNQSFADRREHLPSRNPGCNGRPPTQAFPSLNTPRRPFTCEQESALFDLQLVDAYLSQWEWRRTVDSRGRISLADHKYFINRDFKGQMVKIHFDPQTREFVCSRADDLEIARFTVPLVSREYILGIEQLA